MFARHAVEELLKAWRREQRVVRVADMQLFKARLVIQQRGEQMGSDAQLAGCLQFVVVTSSRIKSQPGMGMSDISRIEVMPCSAIRFISIGVSACNAIPRPATPGSAVAAAWQPPREQCP